MSVCSWPVDGPTWSHWCRPVSLSNKVWVHKAQASFVGGWCCDSHSASRLRGGEYSRPGRRQWRGRHCGRQSRRFRLCRRQVRRLREGLDVDTSWRSRTTVQHPRETDQAVQQLEVQSGVFRDQGRLHASHPHRKRLCRRLGELQSQSMFLSMFRLNYLSHGIKIWTGFSSVLSQSTRLTDRRTDGQTEFSSLDRVCFPCSTVKTREVQGVRISDFRKIAQQNS